MTNMVTTKMPTAVPTIGQTMSSAKKHNYFYFRHENGNCSSCKTTRMTALYFHS